MDESERKYIDGKLLMIRSIITGTIAGIHMFPIRKNHEHMTGEIIRKQTDSVMDAIEQDIINIYKHGKRKTKEAEEKA